MTAHVQHDAAALGRHHLHRGVELRTAVAAQRPEHVAGEAFGVDAHQHVVTLSVGAGDVAHHERHMFDVVVHAGVADGAEIAVLGGIRVGDPHHVLLVAAAPVMIGGRDQCEVVFIGKTQLVGLRHVPFVLLADDLADHARGCQPGQAGQGRPRVRQVAAGRRSTPPSLRARGPRARGG